MKRAFLVIGSEGSGTYMLAEAFVSAGCTYCDKDDVTEFLSEQQPDLLVLRRSLPHAGEWPDIDILIESLKSRGYSVLLYGILRDCKASLNSVWNRDRETSTHQFYKAARMTIDYLEHYPGILIIYEYFVQSRSYRNNVMSFDLFKEPTMEFYDGNAKYYE